MVRRIFQPILLLPAALILGLAARSLYLLFATLPAPNMPVTPSAAAETAQAGYRLLEAEAALLRADAETLPAAAAEAEARRQAWHAHLLERPSPDPGTEAAARHARLLASAPDPRTTGDPPEGPPAFAADLVGYLAYLAEQETTAVTGPPPHRRRPIPLWTLFWLVLALAWFFAELALMRRPLAHVRHALAEIIPEAAHAASGTASDLQPALDTLVSRYQATRRDHRIVTSLTEGLILVSPAGIIEHANSAICTMLGYTRDALIGRAFTDIYVKVRSVRVQGFFKSRETYKEEELFKSANGNVVPVRFSSSFLFDEEHEVQGIICIAKDITKEKQVEHELQKQKDWFQITLASITDAVITTDTEGRINYANKVAADLLGLHDDAREVGLFETFRLLDLDSRLPVRLLTPAELQTDSPTSRACLLHCADERLRTIDLVQAPILSAERALQGTVLVFRDITELRRAAMELREARDKAQAALEVKGRFLANMSHEIRTPMNGVVGMTDLILASNLTHEQREIAEIIRTSGESLLNLLNDILDLSKVEAGRLRLEAAPFDPRATAEDVGDLMIGNAREKGLELVLLIHHELPHSLIGDQGRLRQILLNLVGNAVKFTARGEVVVALSAPTLSDSRCTLHCEVRDTGIGISPDALSSIFQPFTQADASTTRKFGGTGLGLAICKELCEAMGGRIWATSQQGRGSTFSFEVTFQLDDHLRRDPTLNRHQGLRLLLAENNATNRLALDHQLVHLGCTVTHCIDHEVPTVVQAALDTNTPVQVLMLDDPKHSNLKLEELHTVLRLPGAPRVLLVNTLARQTADDPWMDLADRYLTKPVKLKRLADALSDLMDEPVPHSGEDKAPPGGPRLLPQACRILVAEDNVVNQKVTAGMLERAGYRCDIAADGHQVLNALKARDYDLILMDCQMPEMDGFQATAAIRALPGPKARTPITAMTAHALEGDRERCLEAGMDDYLTKPLRKSELHEVLHRLLPRSEAAAP